MSEKCLFVAVHVGLSSVACSTGPTAKLFPVSPRNSENSVVSVASPFVYDRVTEIFQGHEMEIHFYFSDFFKKYISHNRVTN